MIEFDWGRSAASYIEADPARGAEVARRRAGSLRPRSAVLAVGTIQALRKFCARSAVITVAVTYEICVSARSRSCCMCSPAKEAEEAVVTAMVAAGAAAGAAREQTADRSRRSPCHKHTNYTRCRAAVGAPPVADRRPAEKPSTSTCVRANIPGARLREQQHEQRRAWRQRHLVRPASCNATANRCRSSRVNSIWTPCEVVVTPTRCALAFSCIGQIVRTTRTPRCRPQAFASRRLFRSSGTHRSGRWQLPVG